MHVLLYSFGAVSEYTQKVGLLPTLFKKKRHKRFPIMPNVMISFTQKLNQQTAQDRLRELPKCTTQFICTNATPCNFIHPTTESYRDAFGVGGAAAAAATTTTTTFCCTSTRI